MSRRVRLNSVEAVEAEIRWLSAEIERLPDRRDYYQERANLYARLGKWNASAADYLLLTELAPERYQYWMQAGPTLIMAGDTEGYHALRQQVIARLGDTTNPTLATTVCRTCLLLPDLVELSQLPQTIQEGLEQEKSSPSNPDLSQKQQDEAVARGRIALALVEYRAGNLEKSLEWSGKSKEFNVDYITSLALLLQSMVEFRLGKAEEARQTLVQATELMPAGFRSPGRSGHNGPFPLPSQMVKSDNLFWEILRREAEALIAGETETPRD